MCGETATDTLNRPNFPGISELPPALLATRNIMRQSATMYLSTPLKKAIQTKGAKMENHRSTKSSTFLYLWECQYIHVWVRAGEWMGGNERFARVNYMALFV